MQSRIQFAVLLLALVLPFAAHGDAGRRVGVVVLPLETALAKDVVAVQPIFEAAIQAQDDVRIVDLAWHARAGEKEILERRADDAGISLERGLSAFDMLQFEEARDHFRRAIELYEASDLTRHFSSLLDAHALHAAALFFGGDASEATNEMVQLFTLSPGYVFDAQRRSPDLAAALEAARGRVQAMPATALEVLSEPVPAEVHVNGVFRGVSPVEVRGLAPGHHYVTVRAAGFNFSQDNHLAEPGALVRLRLAPAPNGRPLVAMMDEAREALKSGNVGPVAKSIAHWANLDEVVLAGLDQEEGTLLLTAARVASDGHIESTHHLQLEWREAAARTAMRTIVPELYAAPLPRGPNGAPVTQMPQRASGPSRTALMGWGAVGAGAVATATGVGLSVRASRLRREALDIPQTHEHAYEAVMGSRRRSMVGAGAGYVLAAVGFGVGAWLLLDGAGSVSGPRADRLVVVPTVLPGAASVSVAFELP